MWFRVNAHSGIPVYVQLKEQIKKAIASGQLDQGEQLPSVRDMAVELTVNPNTVGRVYRELEQEGILRTARGQGTFVAVGRILPESEWEEALDEILENLMVEAYQLKVEAEVLRARFLTKLEVWQPRLKGRDKFERD